MFQVLDSLPTVDRAFIVAIPRQLYLPLALEHPYLKVVFDIDTEDFYFVKGEVPCKGISSTVTHGILELGHPSLALLYYLQHGVPLPSTSFAFLTHYYSKSFQHISDINTKVPLVKWLEYAQYFFNLFKQVDWDSLHKVHIQDYATFLYNLQQVEQAGLKVNPSLFKKFFEQPYYLGDFAYTKYNPFTITGRPSNAYHNINFAALPKHGGARSCFVSRFPKGKLVELDFKSYHVHLVANLTNYTFEEEDVHSHLGKLYFNTSNLTESQYEESKARTFKALYSNDKPDHPFFHGIKRLTEVLYDEYTSTGGLTSPIFNRRITGIAEASANKVFNYFVQCYETERNASVLQEILTLLGGSSSRLVLYTYDSFLIDFNPEDGPDLWSKLLVYIKDQQYPCSVKVGSDYHNMIKISI